MHDTILDPVYYIIYHCKGDFFVQLSFLNSIVIKVK